MCGKVAYVNESLRLVCCARMALAHPTCLSHRAMAVQDGAAYHTGCFRCAHGGCTKQLTIATYRFSQAESKIYCAKHFAEREPRAAHAYTPLKTSMHKLASDLTFLFGSSACTSLVYLAHVVYSEMLRVVPDAARRYHNLCESYDTSRVQTVVSLLTHHVPVRLGQRSAPHLLCTTSITEGNEETKSAASVQPVSAWCVVFPAS